MTATPASAASRVALVTGASSGIGSATARAFASRGYRVALAARREDRLRELCRELEQAGHEALVVPTDLGRPREAAALVERTLDAWGRIDVLVNNAGYGLQRRFTETAESQIEEMFAVNVLSAMTLARAAAARMLQQRSGSIINVASVGGVVAHPLNVLYCATKHALVGFSRALRLELKGSGVRVTAVCPGATRTQFFDVARSDIPFDTVVETFSAPPETVARAIVSACRRNRALIFPTWSAWLLHFADRWLPWLSEWGNVRYRDKVLAARPTDNRAAG